MINTHAMTREHIFYPSLIYNKSLHTFSSYNKLSRVVFMRLFQKRYQRKGLGLYPKKLLRQNGNWALSKFGSFS